MPHPLPGRRARGAVQGPEHVAQLVRHPRRRRDGPRPGRPGPGLPAGTRRADEPHPAEAQLGHRQPGARPRQAGGQHARGRVRALQAAGLRRRLRVLRLAGRRVRRHRAGRGRLARRSRTSRATTSSTCGWPGMPAPRCWWWATSTAAASSPPSSAPWKCWTSGSGGWWPAGSSTASAATPALLDPALEYTLRRTGRPVLGVVPYLASLGLPQEDSVEFKSGQLDAEQAHGRHAQRPPGANGDAVEIAVIDLPHISNFTDLDAFRGESDVRLRIVRTPADLRQPDAVLIPGSKNTLADLGYLRQSGLADRIGQLARSGRTEVVGICGGFQMLGREIRDPAGPGIGRGGRRRAGTAGCRHGAGRRKDARPHHRPPRGLGPGGRGLRNPSRPDRRRRLRLPFSAGRRPAVGCRQRRRPRLGHLSARRLRRRPLPPLVHRPPAGPPRPGGRWAG